MLWLWLLGLALIALADDCGAFQQQDVVEPTSASSAFAIQRVPASGLLMPVQSTSVGGLPGTLFLVADGTDSVFTLKLSGRTELSKVYDSGVVPVEGQREHWSMWHLRPAAAGDLNGDGRVDLAFASVDGCRVILLLSEGELWAVGGILTCDAVVSSLCISSLGSEDNGRALIASFFDGEPSIRVYKHNGVAGIVETARIALGSASKPRSVGVMDANRDGHPDLVLFDARGKAPSLFAQGEAGDFKETPGFFKSDLDCFVSASCMVDLDGDGSRDVAILSETLTAVSVLLTTAPKKLHPWNTPAPTLVTGGGLSIVGVALGVDDGYELAWTLQYTGGVGIIRGKGSDRVFIEVKDISPFPYAIATMASDDLVRPYYVVSDGIGWELVVLRRR
ncbi:MAG: hypothetical protein DRQ55_13100 [Planctomycetota bacterium]|nr:MAG: hypothetical protein DRQ55_13100 [Planctomycetota bacterium]